MNSKGSERKIINIGLNQSVGSLGKAETTIMVTAIIRELHHGKTIIITVEEVNLPNTLRKSLMVVPLLEEVVNGKVNRTTMEEEIDMVAHRRNLVATEEQSPGRNSSIREDLGRSQILEVARVD